MLIKIFATSYAIPIQTECGVNRDGNRDARENQLGLSKTLNMFLHVIQISSRHLISYFTCNLGIKIREFVGKLVKNSFN